MTEDRIQRRLAAVIAADVVGYSRLMETDEAGTLAELKSRHKQVLQPLVARHRGRIFKVTGDGVMMEFASAVNALQCAIYVQHAMAAANAALPEKLHIVLRIGVNLGDVMVDGSDLYGDGVNIAARTWKPPPKQAASSSPERSTTTSETRQTRTSKISERSL